MEIFTNFWFSLGITAIIAVVAIIYYFKGRSAGIMDVLMAFKELEPKAYDRAISKLKARIGNND